MEDSLFVRECDQCCHIFKQSTRFKNQQDKAKFEAELNGWVTIARHNGTNEGLQNHFCKNLCAIQFLQKDSKVLEMEQKVKEAANG